MAGADELLATVEAVYAAGLDETLWTQALVAIMRTVGGVAATLELFDREPLTLREIHSCGLPPANEIRYMDEMAPLNPRNAQLLNGKSGQLHFDYNILDEAAIDLDPFYQDFLAPAGFRYFAGGILIADGKQSALFSVQRSIRQGHATKAELALTKLLLPHIRQAFDMTLRLRGATKARHSLEHALDWLADGVALIRADGSIAYANDSFQEIVRSNDGLRVKKNAVEFAFPAARTRFDSAIANILALRSGSMQATGADFIVARPSGTAPYVLSVRPLKLSYNERASGAAVAIVFIRHPPDHGIDDIGLLREVFGFTSAEAGVALALRQGISLGEYASTRGISLNTVYTHARRVKEKTGCHRLPELIGRLNEVKTLLRRS